MSGRRPASVLFYVQHMLGVGHVFRARRIIEGLNAAGIAVDVLFGGVPIEGEALPARSVRCLPPVRAGAIDFSVYTDGAGNALTADYLAGRQADLLDAFAGLEPDAIVIEQFPFGRRVLRAELLALLEQAHARRPRPLVICSVRDILQEKRKPGRTEEAVETVEKWFDAVLVHSDPSVIALDATLPLASRIEDKLHYTGFVVPPASGGTAGETFDVVVTAGGGAFGEGLLRAALAAHGRAGAPGGRWCLVTGPNLPRDVARDLREMAPPGLEIRRFLPDLWRSLAAASLSVSQAGYNTATDILRARCRAVLVPSDIVGQTEQLRRAELLAEAGLAVCLPESRLTPDRLAEAMSAALELPPAERDIDLSGVETSARIIGEMIAKRNRAA